MLRRLSVDEHVCQLALARAHRRDRCIPRITERQQRCFRRLTFTIVSFGPLFHRNDQGAPLSRRPRDCAVKNVISEWCFHRILLRLTCPPPLRPPSLPPSPPSRNNDRFVFAKEEKLRAAAVTAARVS